MTWTFAIATATLCLAGHILSVKFLGDRLPSSFVTPAFYTVALLSLIVVAFIEKPKVNLPDIATWQILVPLVIAGVTIGLTDFFFVKSLNLGAESSTAMPVLLGGATLIVAVLGTLMFKEVINLQKVLGITLTVAGIFLIHRSS